ncbi:MAG: hypoxanthine phosphoribosyltransferase [Chlorobi bacterium]|nr:hypoxanthine phosphoribosyltransferase [Chlorobiota bacterium]
MSKIQILDKQFKLFIPAADIQKAVTEMAGRMNEELKGRDIIFIAILNGAFMFAADLYRKLEIPSRITFLKLASYEGTTTSGKVKRLVGLGENLKGLTVVVIEDIVDTGVTLDHIVKQLKGYEPADIKIATLFFKPGTYRYEIPLDYVGIEVPDEFIVGYGLDYNGYGRNLEDLYVL